MATTTTALTDDELKNKKTGYQAPVLPTPNDYSSYVENMYRAKRDAQLAALESAYRQNVMALDNAQAKIAPQYQSARNQTAATGEIAQRNFAEYANATGLNTGASAQQRLAQSVTTQNNLNALNKAEADAQAAIELQRAQLAAQYNSAIATAQAEGDYELAAALMQEKQRQDSQLLSTMQAQAGLNYQAYQAALAAEQQEWSRAQAEKENLIRLGEAYLQNNAIPPDNILAAMGITRDDAQRLINKRVAAQTASAATSSATPKEMSLSQAKSLVKDGVFTQDVLQTLYKYGYTDADIYNLNRNYVPARSTAYVTQAGGGVNTEKEKILEDARYRMAFRGYSPEDVANYLSMMVGYGSITEADALDILRKLGLS
jgi:hypothetical protein